MTPDEGWQIRAMGASDLDIVLDWRNHPAVSEHMLTRHFITAAEHQAWFTKTLHDPSKRLLIVERERRPLGFVQFAGVSPGGAAHWGFYAAPEAAKGTGRKIAQLGLACAFGDLQVHKVCSEVIDRNQVSVRFHLRLGFRQEGVLREQLRMDDGYHDLICFGLLAREWRVKQAGEPSS